MRYLPIPKPLMSEGFMRRLRATVQKLQRRCPTTWPVWIQVDRSFAQMGCLGYCDLRKNDAEGSDTHFLVRIAGDIDRWRMIEEICIHEWAHAIAWTPSVRKGSGRSAMVDHSALWGVAYAECYRAVYGERS